MGSNTKSKIVINIAVISKCSKEMKLLIFMSSNRKEQFKDIYIRPDHDMAIIKGTLPNIGPGQSAGS
jgi:hypothetical protein